MILLLILITLSSMFNEFTLSENIYSDPVEVSIDNYEDTILYVANKLGINISDAHNYYRYMYGGRVVSFSIRDLDLQEIIGLRSIDILFEAYTDKGWVKLPYRVYSSYIDTPHAIHYIVSYNITVNTTIDIRLPSSYPLETDPQNNRPLFAHGAEKWAIIYIELNRGLKIPIYLFIKPHYINLDPYAYSI